jgi:cell division protein ZapA
LDDKQQKNRVTVTIMGEDYTIKGSSSPQMMEKAARHVDHLMRTLAVNNRSITRHRIAVLTAINLADELLKQKQGFQQHPEEIRERGDEDELV